MEHESMDEVLRGIAIFLEVVLLSAVVALTLRGVQLMLRDWGVGAQYNKPIGLALVLVFAVIAIFFFLHVSLFYPLVGGE